MGGGTFGAGHGFVGAGLDVEAAFVGAGLDKEASFVGAGLDEEAAGAGSVDDLALIAVESNVTDRFS